MTSTLHGQAVEPDCAADVLAFARSRRAEANRAEADVLAAAVTWAMQHPAESIHDAACWPMGEGAVSLAGPGAPEIAEFAVPEFAAALGMTTDGGKRLIGQALELAHRLPRHWARVQAGKLPAWRARRLAEDTMTLSPEAAAWVDSQLAAYLHKTSLAAQQRLVAEAIARFDPQRAQQDADRAEDHRHVSISHDQISFWGTSRLEGELDLADALDLEAALESGAAQMADLGSTESLDVRRSKALGALARGDLFLDLPRGAEPAEHARPSRSVVLYVHLSEAALRSGASSCFDLARVENARQVVTVEKVRQWCGRPDAQIVLKPVIDLEDHIQVEQYEVPDRLAAQTELSDHTCVFPWCSRPAKRCDKDHVVAHDRDGPTCSCNLAPLCRRHHRLKTHAAWSYVPLEPGTYVWASPHGYSYLVDGTGTTDVTAPERRGRPLPPHALQP
jgi:hypothetical protein